LTPNPDVDPEEMNMSPDVEENSATLQVAAANDRDVGKGTARLPEHVIADLGLQAGGIIEIVGERSTGAVALPPYPTDEGLSIIRLDGLTRANANVGIGDHVEVRRAEAPQAKKVTLAPAQKNIMLQGSGEALHRTFMQRPVQTGDVVSTSVYRRSAGGEPGMPRDLARLFGQQRAFALAEIKLTVTATKPRGIVRVGPETEIELLSQYAEPEGPRQSGVSYDDVGGMTDVIEQVREMIELPLKHPELFSRLGIDPPKGVLLHGPPGTGKTLLARAVASESDAQFFHVAGPEIMGSQYGESEKRLREVFEQAQESSPAIIFFDEIDSIAPKREEARGEVERRVVAQLLTLMDGLEPRQNVVVIGATNRLESLDEALRRPGRFDREIVIGVPDQDGRRQILTIHTRGMPLADDVDLDELARTTYGFVGADISALTREAAIDALRRVLPEIDFSETEIAPDVLDSLEVTDRDFETALKRVQPSALREIMIQAPNVGWDDIGGLAEAKVALREGVELPLRSPESFERLGIRPAKGFLLFGPPGTGKTLMAKAVAREAEANFIATKSSDLLSKWYGESEQQIARLFKRARQVAPTVIFIDEIDSLAPQRGGSIGEPAVTERVVNTLLAEMDGLETMENIVVIGATNRPTLLDPALLRPGRFDEIVYIPVPDIEGRRRILDIHTRAMPLTADVDLEELAEKTQGFTGADLENLSRKAGLLALRRDVEADEVSHELFLQALAEIGPSVTPEMETEYEQMVKSLKQRSASASQRLGFQLE
jgi:transitional endoplasmic reticulum ATPase